VAKRPDRLALAVKLAKGCQPTSCSVDNLALLLGCTPSEARKVLRRGVKSGRIEMVGEGEYRARDQWLTLKVGIVPLKLGEVA